MIVTNRSDASADTCRWRSSSFRTRVRFSLKRWTDAKRAGGDTRANECAKSQYLVGWNPPSPLGLTYIWKQLPDEAHLL
jgi:hypothetical protein